MNYNKSHCPGKIKLIEDFLEKMKKNYIEGVDYNVSNNIKIFENKGEKGEKGEKYTLISERLKKSYLSSRQEWNLLNNFDKSDLVIIVGRFFPSDENRERICDANIERKDLKNPVQGVIKKSNEVEREKVKKFLLDLNDYEHHREADNFCIYSPKTGLVITWWGSDNCPTRSQIGINEENWKERQKICKDLWILEGEDWREIKEKVQENFVNSQFREKVDNYSLFPHNSFGTFINPASKVVVITLFLLVIRNLKNGFKR